jgi:hypothetical protein
MSLDFDEKEEPCIMKFRVVKFRRTWRLSPRLWYGVTSEGLKGGSRIFLAHFRVSGSEGVGELNNRNREVAKPDVPFSRKGCGHMGKSLHLVLVRIGVTPKKDMWLQV